MTCSRCGQTAKARGLCSTHYNRDRVAGKFSDATCVHLGCERPVHAKQRCKNHYQLVRPRCTIDGCNRPMRARQLCAGHLRAEKLYGDPLAARRWVRNAKCEIPGCTDRHLAKGLCSKHYEMASNMRAKDPGINPHIYLDATPVKELVERAALQLRFELRMEPEKDSRGRARVASVYTVMRGIGISHAAYREDRWPLSRVDKVCTHLGVPAPAIYGKDWPE